MMGEWRDIRSATGRLFGQIDTERRLMKIVRNGEEELIDLDAFLGDASTGAASTGSAAEPGRGPAVGPGESKGGAGND